MSPLAPKLHCSRVMKNLRVSHFARLIGMVIGLNALVSLVPSRANAARTFCNPLILHASFVIQPGPGGMIGSLTERRQLSVDLLQYLLTTNDPVSTVAEQIKRFAEKGADPNAKFLAADGGSFDPELTRGRNFFLPPTHVGYQVWNDDFPALTSHFFRSSAPVVDAYKVVGGSLSGHLGESRYVEFDGSRLEENFIPSTQRGKDGIYTFVALENEPGFIRGPGSFESSEIPMAGYIRGLLENGQRVPDRRVFQALLDSGMTIAKVDLANLLAEIQDGLWIIGSSDEYLTSGSGQGASMNIFNAGLVLEWSFIELLKQDDDQRTGLTSEEILDRLKSLIVEYTPVYATNSENRRAMRLGAVQPIYEKLLSHYRLKMKQDPPSPRQDGGGGLFVRIGGYIRGLFSSRSSGTR